MKKIITPVFVIFLLMTALFAEEKISAEKTSETKENLKLEVEDVDAAVLHLIQFIGESKCSFERNGTWHSAENAAKHLKSKYDYGKKRKAIKTPEDFIDKCASGSSVTGEQYTVKKEDGEVVKSAELLRSELKRYREEKLKNKN